MHDQFKFGPTEAALAELAVADSRLNDPFDRVTGFLVTRVRRQ